MLQDVAERLVDGAGRPVWDRLAPFPHGGDLRGVREACRAEF